MEPVPALVTLHVWRVPPAKAPLALARMARDRGAARRTAGVRFAKMLGTGRGFAVHEADPTRWAKLSTWAVPGADPVAAAWQRLADETLRLELRPLASTGAWSGRAPFGAPTPCRYDGPLAALTRARLSPARAAAFWRAVPPVRRALATSPGLRASLAVGEAPVGLQGTVSLWDCAASARAFTTGPAHARAVARTAEVGWYAEELFARFEVLSASGTLDGREPFA
ncbi:MAG: monooxygenase [Mycobacteriales bacterium]